MTGQTVAQFARQRLPAFLAAKPPDGDLTTV
jgi:hypothetical protein